MRILITNDDGVFAPGIAALARGLHAAFGDQHELVVVAPLPAHSGDGITDDEEFAVEAAAAGFHF